MSIPLRTFIRVPNWGDRLSGWIVSRMGGTIHEVALGADLSSAANGPQNLMAIGSVLQSADDHSVVWGSGMISPDQLGSTKASFRAVRGKLTAAELEKRGITPPTAFGDPALLMSRFYQPNVPKHYRLGVIPHFVDRDHPVVQQLASLPDVTVLNVASGITDFADQVAACEAIVSTSLHGLIAADVYGVPRCQLVLSDRIIGGDFKYRDYASGAGLENWQALDLSSAEHYPALEDVLERCALMTPQWDAQALIDAFPSDLWPSLSQPSPEQLVRQDLERLERFVAEAYGPTGYVSTLEKKLASSTEKLTSLKTKASEQSAKVQSLKAKLDDTKASAKKLRQLNADLEKVQRHPLRSLFLPKSLKRASR
ncbi:polysaccharide pyruvyl transferase family protein [Sulfuriroseicoccus oceanibius]|uniref:Polysaccharide pyruvyl transferase family protein n=1 Tax=Sulfuriroseicoccus oceanibius TaxID=2707525 RepID=A0A6B3L8R4_9BACT|nr:polysaccharide pyruvyl transferase family protein [Sulfuriroseicoccus oceanibius]QQL45468.1 polysaccharide pyruvyl transferase family protein [Sulfuriroseicoccus oceanibius]